MRLTDDLIRRAKRPTRGQTLLRDDLVYGFGVSAESTSFVVQWREANGRKPRAKVDALIRHYIEAYPAAARGDQPASGYSNAALLDRGLASLDGAVVAASAASDALSRPSSCKSIPLRSI
jgi:hypothetical protein